MADLPPLGELLLFDRFRLDRTQRLLWSCDQLLPLEPKVFDTLLALVEAHGRLVTKDELLARVWPDTFVEEGSLPRNVHTLRRVLGEGFIETIPKRGYRFVAQVRTPEPPVAVVESTPGDLPPAEMPPLAAVPVRRRMAAAWMALALAIGAAFMGVWSLASSAPDAASAGGTVRSIAVLPLRNLSGADQEYFSDGITEELITTLAQIRSLRVISRTSIMRFKHSQAPLRQIARELGVDAVIEGSIQRDGDRVRVTAQLIDARTDTHLWAHAYDERLADVLALQTAVARGIASQVEVRLSPQEAKRLSATRTVVPAAYDAFLRGQALRWRGVADLPRALDQYDRAVSLDPTYAPAYAGLALTWTAFNSPGALAAQRIAATRALELDPDLPEAHAALASVKYRDWDWEGGNAESRLALELNPGALDGCFCYASSLAATGQLREALVVADRSVLSNPLEGGAHLARGNALFFSRRYNDAVAAFRRGLELDPAYDTNRLLLGSVYDAMGRADDAITLLEPLQNFPNGGLRLAAAYARAGRRVEAAQILERLTTGSQTPEALFVAIGHAALGKREKSLEWLERSADTRETRASFLLHPGLDPIRQEPRFRVLVKRLRMPASFEAAEQAVAKRAPGSPPS